MGEFSWIYADTNKQIINNKIADTYLLVPQEFQNKYGKAIHEKCYNGYGIFGGYDIYNLIIEWNRDFIPEIINKIKNKKWYCNVSEQDIKNLENYYNKKTIDCELRWLGIIIACYDEDNFALKYPIKITTKKMNYENASPSKTDSKQGWKYYDEYDEEKYNYNENYDYEKEYNYNENYDDDYDDDDGKYLFAFYNKGKLLLSGTIDGEDESDAISKAETYIKSKFTNMEYDEIKIEDVKGGTKND